MLNSKIEVPVNPLMTSTY